MNPVIVVIAFNRVDSLSRCLDSLNNAIYSESDKPLLIISIDKSDTTLVEEFAHQFEFLHGEKKVIAHEKNLGLKEHILFCFSLSETYDSIILLEDDCFVSPYFYDYCIQTLTFYGEDSKVCGISLYAYDHNEFVRMPFIPVDDGYDNYFMKVPSSLGQLINKRMWLEFKSSYIKGECELQEGDALPSNIFKWEKSWKKYYFKYMVKTDKFFVYPRISLTTNFCDVGTNFISPRIRYQVNLLLCTKNFFFSRISESRSVYDAYYEICLKYLLKSIAGISTDNIEMDLYALKSPDVFKNKFFITPRNFNGTSLTSFSNEMWPHEMNIVLLRKGSFFHLINTEILYGNYPTSKILQNHAFYKADNFIIREKAYNDCELNLKQSLTWRVGNIFVGPIKAIVRLFKR